jgi:hypothetical protein
MLTEKKLDDTSAPQNPFDGLQEKPKFQNQHEPQQN